MQQRKSDVVPEIDSVSLFNDDLLNCTVDLNEWRTDVVDFIL